MTGYKRGALVLLAATVALVASVALATPPSGFDATLLARGKVGRIHLHNDGVKLRSKRKVDHVVLRATVAPGGSSGWHHHPGVGLASVASGAVTVYDEDCNGTVYEAGEGFKESHDDPGLVRNEGTTEAVFNITFIIPTKTPAEGLRIDDPQPEDCDVK
jgi:quercetin dioxygenase-like cupin family protein